MLDRPDILYWAAAFGPILKAAFPAETAARRMAVGEALGKAVMDRQSWFSPALTPSPLSDLHPLGQEYDGDALREALAHAREGLQRICARKYQVDASTLWVDMVDDMDAFAQEALDRSAIRVLSATPPAQTLNWHNAAEPGEVPNLVSTPALVTDEELDEAFRQGDCAWTVRVAVRKLFERTRTLSATVDETERLRAEVEGYRKLTREQQQRITKLEGALMSHPPIKPDYGSWWYPEGDTSSDACCHGPSEALEGPADEMEEGEARMVVLERAIALPDVYAALRVFTEAEKDARDDDEPWDFTLHATAEQARAALSDRPQAEGEVNRG